MKTITFIAILFLAAAMILSRGGSLDSGSRVLAIAALVLALPWYFGTRDRSKPATQIERALARCWLWFRRLVCGGISLLLFFFAFAPLIVESKLELSWSNFFWVVGFSLVGLVVALIGIFGYGGAYYGDNAGALKMYRENKKRYQRRR